MFDDSVAVLARAGLDTSALADSGRRLTAQADDGTLYIMTRPSDVPTYVEAGAADVGIVGKDVLLEHEPDVYELCDLDFGHCYMAYATLAGDDPTPGVLARLGTVRVATKYPRVALAHFEASGRQAEVVKVNGSVELAPLVELAHGIVDLVATGATMRENGLVEREHIFDSSARLIANRVSDKFAGAAVDRLLGALETS